MSEKDEPTVEESVVEEPVGAEEHNVVSHHVDLEHVLNDLECDEEHGYFIDEQGNPLSIKCRRRGFRRI